MYVGVDFGTSFSQAATMHNGHPLVLLPSDTYGIPSEFYYDSDSGVQVGQDALDYGEGINAKYLISEFKMKLREVPNAVSLDGRRFAYSDMVQSIYQYVLHISQNVAQTKMINNSLEGLVLTMPVNFGLQEKNILREAAQNCMAGTSLRVMGILKEPVAAAIAYYKDSLDDGKTILVFDLGGGTCDVALVRSDKSADEMFTVIDGAMERIGGRDWDTELMKFISDQVENKTGIRIIDNDYYRKQLKAKAVEVKKKLSDGISTSASARIAMQNGRIISVPITLNTFEEITYGLMMRALDCLKQVYSNNVSKHNIEEIVCVGGSSNMRQVRYNIQREFPDMTVRLYEPEHAVVNGAAIYADLIHMRPEPVIRDIASFSYGIRAYEDYDRDKNKKAIFNLVRKGNPLPAKEVHTFCPPEDHLASVSLVIFESENRDSKYDEHLPCTKIGHVSFPLPPNSTKHFQIHCEMSLLGDGFLYFNARDNEGNNVPARFKLSE